jgi:hypothetical protein
MQNLANVIAKQLETAMHCAVPTFFASRHRATIGSRRLCNSPKDTAGRLRFYKDDLVAIFDSRHRRRNATTWLRNLQGGAIAHMMRETNNAPALTLSASFNASTAVKKANVS